MILLSSNCQNRDLYQDSCMHWIFYGSFPSITGIHGCSSSPHTMTTDFCTLYSYCHVSHGNRLFKVRYLKLVYTWLLSHYRQQRLDMSHLSQLILLHIYWALSHGEDQLCKFDIALVDTATGTKPFSHSSSIKSCTLKTLIWLLDKSPYLAAHTCFGQRI